MRHCNILPNYTFNFTAAVSNALFGWWMSTLLIQLKPKNFCYSVVTIEVSEDILLDSANCLRY